ncbi:hypothetical protein BaRGS_00002063 [Batillaria attramentaria]|uniref:J domain-containing protein n=1 Tax=Batillaria attramentaria TaxID=370345 RepID=A0ABD0M4G1_9CAEN
MDKILSYERHDADDFYHIIGCSEHSSEEQILTEYRARVLDCHPDKHPGDAKKAERFNKLTKAKETLSNPESRAKYDQWRRSGIAMSYDDWLALRGAVHTSMHWATKAPQPQLVAPYEGEGDASDSTGSTKMSLNVSSSDGATPFQEPRQLSPRHYQKAQVVDLTFRNAGQPIVTGDRMEWTPDTGRPLLQKFRNYQI